MITHQKIVMAPVNENLLRFQNNDAGNGERFIAVHGKNYRFNRDAGTWLKWNGIRWETANEDATQAFIHTMRALASQAVTLADATAADAYTKHALRSCDLYRVKAGMTLAQSVPGISISAGQLDSDPFLACAKNAVIDLRTGQSIEPHRDQLITKQLGAEFDPHAECPLWLEFLDTVTGRDEELRQFLQVAIGYTLTGHATEECLFFLYGTGQNGKGVFTKITEAILGDYSQTAPESLFVVNKHGGGVPNDLARLVGCRMAVLSELDEGAAFAESRLKSLTGNDTITARFLHKEFFDFGPTHKFWISGNHRPAVRGTDKGIWRRMRLVPFTVCIPEEKKDKSLKQKLMNELPGILNWAVQGCIAWNAEGLSVPSCVKAATEEYRMNEDVIGQFLEEATRPTGETTKSDLYTHYTNWAEKAGIRYKLTLRKFNDRIAERGDYQERRTNSARVWLGISTISLW
jgi:putative DNA primase/helicase